MDVCIVVGADGQRPTASAVHAAGAVADPVTAVAPVTVYAVVVSVPVLAGWGQERAPRFAEKIVGTFDNADGAVAMVAVCGIVVVGCQSVDFFWGWYQGGWRNRAGGYAW